MQPFDYLDEINSLQKIINANDFWKEKYSNIFLNNFNKYNHVEIDELQQLFKKYQARVFNNNNKYFIKFGQKSDFVCDTLRTCD